MRRTALVPIIGALMLALLAPSAMAQPSGRADLVTDVPFSGEITGVEPGAAFGTVGDELEGFITLTGLDYARDGDSLSLLADGVLEITQPVQQSFPFSGQPIGLTRGTTGSTGLVASLAGTQVAQGGGQCQILLLQLDGLFLDLLGLQVTLQPVELDITAVRGPGNLLGNLLCAVVGILDPQPNPVGNLLNRLTRLLDRINNLIGA
jgi:hypothetical protein